MSIKPITKEYKTIEEFLKFRNIDCLTDIQELNESKNIIILGNFDGSISISYTGFTFILFGIVEIGRTT